ncbi:glutathione S-transferase family protein [Stigmatella aurantiaca]|uniref:Glutathione S-transferase, N-terminal n=1 Tax=Stigmatella aurantiaca (strain DW4/3-1) TaxID=378806 RepID=Q092M3_STIAD|nr:glutathione S-transferase family protein [Stigmatella aurantiaca]ADO70768.1 Glutathione transferase [Stigmatella aurantiaca DW4/3-1]EAU66689.1 glutathione S-transferase, N-terminal [Stigmatella aurantiaca DW4/3-1]
MKLYGTITSPFVRRVRIVALELGQPFEFVSTATPEGEAELRSLSPLWKFPTAHFTGNGPERVIWDSRTIVDYLFSLHGTGPFQLPSQEESWHERNVIQALDGALEAAIHLLYFDREGMNLQSSAYLVKQSQRVGSVLTWAESQLHGASFFEKPRLGMAELALLTTLDFMVFRNRYPVAQHPKLVEFQKILSERPSIRQTYPVA